jgi:hypothetical protein
MEGISYARAIFTSNGSNRLAQCVEPRAIRRLDWIVELALPALVSPSRGVFDGLTGFFAGAGFP